MNEYWFRRRKGINSRDLGWGFIPISREGVAAYILLFVSVILAGVYFDILHATTLQGFGFLLTIILLLCIFRIFAQRKTQK